jgi:hypothetical protein
MPNGGKFAVFVFRHLAPHGISRRSAFRAVRHFALFGISRCLAFRAL